MLEKILILVLIITGILFITSVMLMSPKGGLGFGVGGMSGSNEYGSKKSVESTLKKVAIVTMTIFVLVAAFLPYIN